jgi:NAD(P)-dependent dehydrogenase (short-subunit alcohol dehydrogenase family)
MNLVVTGSSSGIGRALVLRLMGHGHQVWGVARSDQSELGGKHKEQFRSSRCDVAQWDQMERTEREVAAAWAHVDGLVTCAGLQGEIGRAVASDPIRWSATVRANLDGTFNAIRAFHGLLARAPRRAKVACFSGGGATRPRARFSAYGAAKTAVVRLVETIAEEEQSTALDINAVAPGAILTRLTEELIALGPAVVGEVEYQAALKQKKAGDAPLERALDLVEWLLSPQSDGISGRLLSAPWDPWRELPRHSGPLSASDVYTLRRILPEDRGQRWDP